MFGYECWDVALRPGVLPLLNLAKSIQFCLAIVGTEEMKIASTGLRSKYSCSSLTGNQDQSFRLASPSPWFQVLSKKKNK
jgi:hypothetical protein